MCVKLDLCVSMGGYRVGWVLFAICVLFILERRNEAVGVGTMFAEQIFSSLLHL